MRTNQAQVFASTSQAVVLSSLLREAFWRLRNLSQDSLVGRKLLENWVQLGRVAGNGLLVDAFLWRAKCQDLTGQAQYPEVREEASLLPTLCLEFSSECRGEKKKPK